MASALNKRQQARNERTLQELIKTVPGNNVCADCGARNPGMQRFPPLASLRPFVMHCQLTIHLHYRMG
jgi:hypothetical protein